MSNQELEYRALKILEQQPNLTQRQLAEALGVSLGKTHYLVKCQIMITYITVFMHTLSQCLSLKIWQILPLGYQ